LQLRAVNETGNVIEHGCAEERFDGFENEDGAIRACNGKIAMKKKPEVAEEGHEVGSAGG
jgi:hypothetical protein